MVLLYEIMVGTEFDRFLFVYTYMCISVPSGNHKRLRRSAISRTYSYVSPKYNWLSVASSDNN